MEIISALGGQSMRLPAEAGVVRQRFFALGSGMPGELSIPGLDFRLAGVQEAGTVNLPAQMHSFMRVSDVSKSYLERSSSSLGAGIGAVKHAMPAVLPERPVPQFGTLITTDQSDAAAIQTRESTEIVSTEKLPYASLIRGMLDRDQVASARTLLSVALADQPTDALRTAAGILSPPTSVKKPLRDRDRGREYGWLTRHGAEHRGEWVALIGDELVATARSLKDLLVLLERSGRKGDALIHRVA